MQKDLATYRGFGVDGCVVQRVAGNRRRVAVRIEDQVAAGRPLTLRIGGGGRTPRTLSVNGKRGRTYGGAALRRGITVSP